MSSRIIEVGPEDAPVYYRIEWCTPWDEPPYDFTAAGEIIPGYGGAVRVESPDDVEKPGQFWARELTVEEFRNMGGSRR
jgi:hypothetical protein